MAIFNSIRATFWFCIFLCLLGAVLRMKLLLPIYSDGAWVSSCLRIQSKISAATKAWDGPIARLYIEVLVKMATSNIYAKKLQCSCIYCIYIYVLYNIIYTVFFPWNALLSWFPTLKKHQLLNPPLSLEENSRDGPSDRHIQANLRIFVTFSNIFQHAWPSTMSFCAPVLRRTWMQNACHGGKNTKPLMQNMHATCMHTAYFIKVCTRGMTCNPRFWHPLLVSFHM